MAALTSVVTRAEVTPAQKQQRVLDWLADVHKVLYSNLDTSKHIQIPLMKDNSLKAKPRHPPVHRLYTSADHAKTPKDTCGRPKTNKSTQEKTGQLPTIPKRTFSSSNSSQPSGFQRKTYSQNQNLRLTSKVVKNPTQHNTRPSLNSNSKSRYHVETPAVVATTPTFRRRLKSATAG